LLATGNPGKARELAELLAGVPYTLVTLADVGLPDDVEEVGVTLEENALIKARSYARRSGLTTLADDSGLEVDALGGAPGVHSKRFAGEDATDEERVAYLLQRLEGTPLEERTAAFRCVLAVAAPDGRALTREGVCRGIITDTPQGSDGFGYDPVFWVPEVGRTMAELTPSEKNRISHRARAAREAAELLRGSEVSSW
jgi:XTP/dITP diphosphohydrolase